MLKIKDSVWSWLSYSVTNLTTLLNKIIPLNNYWFLKFFSSNSVFYHFSFISSPKPILLVLLDFVIHPLSIKDEMQHRNVQLLNIIFLFLEILCLTIMPYYLIIFWTFVLIKKVTLKRFTGVGFSHPFFDVFQSVISAGWIRGFLSIHPVSMFSSSFRFIKPNTMELSRF